MACQAARDLNWRAQIARDADGLHHDAIVIPDGHHRCSILVEDKRAGGDLYGTRGGRQAKAYLGMSARLQLGIRIVRLKLHQHCARLHVHGLRVFGARGPARAAIDATDALIAAATVKKRSRYSGPP